MRTFRAGAGAVLAAAGLVMCVGGAVLAFWIVGPDDVLSLRPHAFRGNVVAVTSKPDLLDYYGSRVVVTVKPAHTNTQVFVGVGHDIDVRSYLEDVPRARLTKVGYPSTVRSTNETGKLHRVLPPADLDWWVAKESGKGRQTLSWELADGPYDLVLMRADGNAGLDLTATFGLEVKGAYHSSLLVLAAGVVLLASGILVAGWLRRKPKLDDSEVQWEGRELWEQNAYWSNTGQPGQFEQPDRVGGVLVPGERSVERTDEPDPLRAAGGPVDDAPPWPVGADQPSGPGPRAPAAPAWAHPAGRGGPPNPPVNHPLPPWPGSGPPDNGRPGSGSGHQVEPPPGSPGDWQPASEPGGFRAQARSGAPGPPAQPTQQFDPQPNLPWRPANPPRRTAPPRRAAPPRPDPPRSDPPRPAPPQRADQIGPTRAHGPAHPAGSAQAAGSAQPAGPAPPQAGTPARPPGPPTGNPASDAGTHPGSELSDFPTFDQGSQRIDPDEPRFDDPDPRREPPPPWLPGPVGPAFRLPAEHGEAEEHA